jgi:uncharacterized protein YndB with AHSA1/START domain
MTTATDNTATLQAYQVDIEATPQAIWDALTTSEWTQRYGYGGAVDYELRPGGAYRAYATDAMLAMGAPKVMVDGEVIEADEPRRLVQTWQALFDAHISAEATTRVTFEIEPSSDGVTKLTVTHELEGAPMTAGIVSGAIVEAGGGWPFTLGDLKALLETGTSSHAA